MIIKEFHINKSIIDNHNIFLFYGINEGLKDEIIRSRFKNQKNTSFKSINEIDVIKDEINFFAEITTKSFFDNKKTILINNVTNKIFNIIEQIIEKNIEDITFILNAGLLDKKSKIRKLFETKKNLICVAFYEDNYTTLEKLIKNFFAERKIQISQEVVNFFIIKVAQNRKMLNEELKKIDLFLINKKKISLNDLKILLNTNEEIDFSNFVDQCLLKNKQKTFFILNENNFSNEDTIIIIRTFLYKMKKLLSIRNNYDENKDIDELISDFKPPIFWKDKPIIKDQLNKWPNNSIYKLLDKINQVELLIKSNQNNSKNILFDFIFETIESSNKILRSQ